jgi:hypothetical protein
MVRDLERLLPVLDKVAEKLGPGAAGLMVQEDYKYTYCPFGACNCAGSMENLNAWGIVDSIKAMLWPGEFQSDESVSDWSSRLLPYFPGMDEYKETWIEFEYDIDLHNGSILVTRVTDDPKYPTGEMPWWVCHDCMCLMASVSEHVMVESP